TPIWTKTLGSPMLGKPALSEDGKFVYIGTQNNTLYELNAVNGDVLSKLVVDGPLRSSPALKKATSGPKTFVYFGAGHKFYMAESTNGILKLDYSTDVGTNIVSSPALGGHGNVPNVPSNLVLIGS